MSPSVRTPNTLLMWQLPCERVLSFPAWTKIYLASAPVDMRRDHDRLCALVRSVFELDPYSGQVFVFVGRRRDRVKVVYWDRGGFVLYYKRLAKGRFRVPSSTGGGDRIEVDATELVMLLGHLDLSVARRTLVRDRTDHLEAWFAHRVRGQGN